jgi:hypothetical protein
VSDCGAGCQPADRLLIGPSGRSPDARGLKVSPVASPNPDRQGGDSPNYPAAKIKNPLTHLPSNTCVQITRALPDDPLREYRTSSPTVSNRESCDARNPLSLASINSALTVIGFGSAKEISIAPDCGDRSSLLRSDLPLESIADYPATTTRSAAIPYDLILRCSVRLDMFNLSAALC